MERAVDQGAGTQSLACHHCGEALSGSPVWLAMDGTPRAFCCDGCAAAAEWIRQSSLGDYYQLRSEAGTRVQDVPDLSSWDRDDVLAEHAVPVHGGLEITVLTDGMRCAACAWLLDRALRQEPGVVDVSANAVTGRVRIGWEPSRVALSSLLGRMAMLGYRPYLATGAARERERTAEQRRWMLRVGIAGLGAMQTMMFAEALYLDSHHQMAIATRDFFRWVALMVSTPVVFFAGWPFLAGAWREWKQRRPGMDVLVATSTLLAYGASVVETLRGGTQVWFDAAAMFVFLLLVGRSLEQRARRVASAQVDALARARPALATRECDDGSREVVPVGLLAVGDVVCIAVGEAVPADGWLLDEEASFEESLLTGESRPVTRAPGASIYAGTVCRERPARLRVTQIGNATRLSQLARLVEQAQAHRPPVARLADRVGSVFVVVLLLLSCVTYVAWRTVDPSRAFEVTLALLVVSCPCALSLAVPAALAACHGALARLGVLAVRAEGLDALGRATDIVFDKTGTLTHVRREVGEVKVFGVVEASMALQLAAALERDSRHPIADAFAGVETRLRAQGMRAVAGQGVEGMVDAVAWRLGRASFAAGRDDDGHVWLGDGQRAVARFTLRESLRPGAREAIEALRRQGFEIHLASGDAEAPVQQLMAALGLDHAHSRQSSEDKLALVRALQREQRVVVMVGDGLNDAPVLAGADVSVAMGEGASLAQRAADMVLTSPSLMRIPQAVQLARSTRRVIRQNFAWAVGYNLLALPLAMSGHVTPGWAALGMALSSLAVTLNALRLMRKRAA